VLVVDDSALVRRLLTDMLESQDDIEVVGTAPDPYVARERIKQLEPDVLTLDIEMPRMDGITFLRNIMRLRPMPVLMVSSLTEKGAEVTLEALEVGAVDFVTKPRMDVRNTLGEYVEELAIKVRAAARARIGPPGTRRAAGEQASPSSGPAVGARSRHLKTTDKVLAIGASTGGTEAIRRVLERMPPDAPGIVIAQHIPLGFSGAFAERMNRQTPLTVREARDGDQVVPGHAFVAPGDRHLKLARDGARYVCRLDTGEPVNRHKPSVDVLFRSVLESAGRNAAAALLTGMGADGAAELLRMREAGIVTIAQDEATSVVWGMPGEAVGRGAAAQVLPLDDIAEGLLNAFATASA
jgi:two-component system chemotaxis response regulator CheB